MASPATLSNDLCSLKVEDYPPDLQMGIDPPIPRLRRLNSRGPYDFLSCVFGVPALAFACPLSVCPV